MAKTRQLNLRLMEEEWAYLEARAKKLGYKDIRTYALDKIFDGVKMVKSYKDGKIEIVEDVSRKKSAT